MSLMIPVQRDRDNWNAVSMHFAHPCALWFLLLVPLWMLVEYFWPPAAVVYPAADAAAGLPRSGGTLVEWLRRGLHLLTVVLIVLATARPRWPDERTRIPAESTAIMLVLDVSGSMNEKDFVWSGVTVSRLDAARRALENFVRGDGELPGRPDDQVGLVTFAARSETVAPPTLSHSAVLQLLADAEPVGTPPESTTNIGDAMIEAIDLLRRAKPKAKTMILVSDGEHNVPDEVVAGAWKPRQAAQLARALGIRVYTIYVGSSPSPGEADGRQALKDVAELTSASYFQADDQEGLLRTCRAIDQQERTRVESFQYYLYHEAYPWLGLAGIVCWGIALLTQMTRWRRIP